MKSNSKKELFTKEVKELAKLLGDGRNELFNLKMQLSQNKLKNTRSIFMKRKEIAMILTALKEKEFQNEKNA